MKCGWVTSSSAHGCLSMVPPKYVCRSYNSSARGPKLSLGEDDAAKQAAEIEQEFKQNVKCRDVGRPRGVPVPVAAEHTEFWENLGKATALQQLRHC